jgi:type IV secretory pathway VirB3-like protein
MVFPGIPLAISLAIACASMLVPVILDGMTAALLCVALLAVNTAIASNGQGAYALSLPAARRFGRSQTMGFYNVAMRLGQVLGPLTMGIMMTVWDAKTGLILLASASATCAVLFLMLSAMPKRPYRRQ